MRAGALISAGDADGAASQDAMPLKRAKEIDMTYGRIVQVLTAAGGPPRTAAVAHAVGTATHCTFGIQDNTGPVGTFRTLPLMWTSAKGATTDTISDTTTAGAVTVSALVASAHSLVDVGPVIAGITRNATTQVFNPYAVSSPATRPIRAMRSLHTTVPFLIANNAASSAAVTITHRLGTANVVAIAFPSGDPTVLTGAAVPIPMVVVQNLGAATATTCELQAQTQSNAVSTAGVDTSVNFDVMILARWGSGLHTFFARPHLLGTANSDDYDAGALAQTGSRPAYAAIYTNIDDIAVGAGTAYTHNLGVATGVIALCEQTVAVGAAKNTLGIVNNATSATQATLVRLNELAGVTQNARAVFLRAWSPVILP